MTHACIRPGLIPVAVVDITDEGGEWCPFCSSDVSMKSDVVVFFGRLRFPSLQREKGLATGIIGLW